MNALSDVAIINEIARIERQLQELRVVAYLRAGIPLPSQCKRMAQLIVLAATTFSMSESVIRGSCQTKPYCRARFAVMWVARQGFGFSMPVIGRGLNNRDHTTVLSGLKRAEELREEDPDFREITDRMLELVAPQSNDSEEPENALVTH